MNLDARAIGALIAGALILGGTGLYELARYRHQQALEAMDKLLLKEREIREFGEYRTQRYALHAYDQMVRGEAPDLGGVSCG